MVGKIAVSISKASQLVTPRYRFVAMSISINSKAIKIKNKNISWIIKLITFSLEKITENQIKSWFNKRLLEIDSRY